MKILKKLKKPLLILLSLSLFFLEPMNILASTDEQWQQVIKDWTVEGDYPGKEDFDDGDTFYSYFFVDHEGNKRCLGYTWEVVRTHVFRLGTLDKYLSPTEIGPGEQKGLASVELISHDEKKHNFWPWVIFTTINQALEWAEDGDTIRLHANYNEVTLNGVNKIGGPIVKFGPASFEYKVSPNFTIPEGLDITLDLNGYTITTSAEKGRKGTVPKMDEDDIIAGQEPDPPVKSGAVVPEERIGITVSEGASLNIVDNAGGGKIEKAERSSGEGVDPTTEAASDYHAIVNNGKLTIADNVGLVNNSEDTANGTSYDILQGANAVTQVTPSVDASSNASPVSTSDGKQLLMGSETQKQYDTAVKKVEDQINQLMSSNDYTEASKQELQALLEQSKKELADGISNGVFKPDSSGSGTPGGDAIGDIIDEIVGEIQENVKEEADRLPTKPSVPSDYTPTIYAKNLTLAVGDSFDPLEGVTANDWEDGNLTEKIEVIKNEVDTSKPGEYQVTYRVRDSYGHYVSKTIKVTVNPKMEALNEVPQIQAEDLTIMDDTKFDPLKGVTAADKEDGDLTEKLEVTENTVDTSKAGTYKVTYKITDSQGASTVKTIEVTVWDTKVKGLRAKPYSTSKIHVTWTNREDADYYVIYKDGKKIAEAEDGEEGYMDKGMKVTDGIFKYQIAAVYDGQEGAKSKVYESTTRPGNPVVNKAFTHKKAIRVETKSQSADGYRVWIRQGGSHPTEYVEKKSTYGNYTFKNLKAGQRYVIKVQGYKLVNGKKVPSKEVVYVTGKASAVKKSLI